MLYKCNIAQFELSLSNAGYRTLTHSLSNFWECQTTGILPTGRRWEITVCMAKSRDRQKNRPPDLPDYRRVVTGLL